MTVTDDRLVVAPGSVVVVRDEEWLVTSMESTLDGQLLHVQGLSELVRGTTASFYESLDDIEVLDPRLAAVRADSSPGYRRARLWLEATLRKAAVPLVDDRLVVSDGMLADPLPYQHSAVRKALDPDNLRPRILLADAVGLGKTLEIGMILSELVRRGRGERILIVCPRHVLEQMQHEMWSRFAMPFVRLDSVGIQRVKQKLPATRNPFTYFNRVIISMDTLKQDHLVTHLRRHRWDAVVIDESHNVTNSATQNNRLARVLSPNTDALILASATPHNGKPESFAELVRLLEPTAVTPTGELIPDEVRRLVIRRHRHSDEVKQVVGADWAERREPQNLLIPATPAEDAVAEELDTVWLHPRSGSSPYSGTTSKLFPWTLAKAFLSSPSALRATIQERIKRIPDTPAGAVERQALDRLHQLNEKTFAASAKYGALLEYLRTIGISKGSEERAVIFAERVPTLEWLRGKLQKEFGFTAAEVELLHGGLTDVDQQRIVESFKQATSPIRILVTGDVASEGVNLHRQCHQLIHYDIPWSLIRIEQRNGRIDRYGQLHRPQITTLLLTPSSETFGGDLRVLTKLIEKEQEAHKALGDAASLMGKYSVEAEEEAIRKVLARDASFDDVVGDAHDPASLDQLAALMALIQNAPPPSTDATDAGNELPEFALYDREIDFLREALEEIYVTPSEPPSRNGVNWREYPDQQHAEFEPPPDLRQRLEVLPQSYLTERRVLEKLKLATSPAKGKQLLDAALKDQSQTSWPEAHYLGPLHPVLEWAADRALARLARNEVFAVRGDVEHATVLLHGTLTDRRGRMVAAAWFSAEFPGFDESGRTGRGLLQIYSDAAEMLAAVGFGTGSTNPGPVSLAGTDSLIAAAVDSASTALSEQFSAATRATRERIARWSTRIEAWQQDAAELGGRLYLRERRIGVDREQQLTDEMVPDRQLVRPLLLVLPQGHPSASPEGW